MAEVLQNLSNALAQVVSNAGQSIVQVDARRRVPATGVVWSEDGVIVTSHHVVREEEKIKVGLPNGDVVAAEFVGRDPTTDLAVIKAEASGLVPPSWVSGSDVAVGHLTLAIGRPLGDLQATLGVVSAMSENWTSPAGGQFDYYLQTDVVMYPGFSGGPLVAVDGTFIGLNTSALRRGVSLTVPTDTVVRVTNALLTDGRIRRGYLGVSAQGVTLPDALQTEFKQETGLMLVMVDPDGPAGQGGLAMGDTIIALDSEPTRSMDELQRLLNGDRVDQTVPVKIVRGGSVQDVSVTIGEREG